MRTAIVGAAIGLIIFLAVCSSIPGKSGEHDHVGRIDSEPRSISTSYGDMCKSDRRIPDSTITPDDRGGHRMCGRYTASTADLNTVLTSTMSDRTEVINDFVDRVFTDKEHSEKARIIECTSATLSGEPFVSLLSNDLTDDDYELIEEFAVDEDHRSMLIHVYRAALSHYGLYMARWYLVSTMVNYACG